jgi:hypothetical protein
MTKENREALRERIENALNSITAQESNQDSTIAISEHTVSRRLLYAGGSQWSNRDWDRTESGWAWVIDEQYFLTEPQLFGFDGHNMIERQTPLYLQDGYDCQTVPEHDGRDPVTRAPARILLEIARGLVAAQAEVKARNAKEDEDAAVLLGQLDQ